MIEANFTGLANLLQTFARGEAVSTAARRSLQAEAERLVAAIREAAPVDEGDLRASVRQEPGDEPGSVRVIAGGTEATTKTTAGGATFDQAVMLEYGTTRSKAQPFFWPTVEAMRGEIKANIVAAATDPET